MSEFSDICDMTNQLKSYESYTKTHVIPIQIMFQVNRRIITFCCLQIWALNHSQIGYDHPYSNASKYKGVFGTYVLNMCFV